VASAVYADVAILLLEYGCFCCQHDSFQGATRKFLDWPQDDKTSEYRMCLLGEGILAYVESFAVDFKILANATVKGDCVLCLLQFLLLYKEADFK
jgi:hypothetical protein